MRWKKIDLDRIKNIINTTNLTNKEIGKLFGRTVSSIERALHYYKIYRQKSVKYKVDKETNCWNCYSHSLNRGYPVFKRNGKRLRISKYYFEQKFGEVPKGKLLCHKCNKSLCINPYHLYIGSYKDNSNDRCISGNSGQKLNKEKVLEIFSLFKKGCSNKVIVKKFNVDPSSISRIRNGKNWKHISRE